MAWERCSEDTPGVCLSTSVSPAKLKSEVTSEVASFWLRDLLSSAPAAPNSISRLSSRRDTLEAAGSSFASASSSLPAKAATPKAPPARPASCPSAGRDQFNLLSSSTRASPSDESTSDSTFGPYTPGGVHRLLGPFTATILQSLHLVLLLIIRALLATGSPAVRRALCAMGLARLVEEAGKGGEVEKLLGSHGPEAPRPLLPPRHYRDRDKLTIVLDLDETLVCAYNTEGLPQALHAAACQGGLQWFDLDCEAPDEEAENGGPKVHKVTVYQRPGLREFLAAASQIGEVVLFTAGLEGYARPLVDRIDPEGRISHRLYRSATVSTGLREHVKDLSVLGRDLRRTVLVDNNPFSFLLQPVNGIPCVPFTGDNSNDRQLLDVLLPLLDHLAKLQDVRPYLLSRFQMPGWFRTRGVPVPQPSTSSHHSAPLTPMPASLLPSCSPIDPYQFLPVEVESTKIKR